MSMGRWTRGNIYLYREPVDMRKGMDGLSVIVSEEMNLEVLSDCIFVFVNKGRDKIKLLVWERNGFWLLYKKLLKERFKWPKWFKSNTLTLTDIELEQLLSGFDLNGMRPHQALKLKHIA